MDELRPCGNPLCDGQVRPSVAYCCDPCGRAHEGRYEIHEDGPLGHTAACLERQKARGVDPRLGRTVHLRAELVTPVQDEFDEMLAAGIERYNAEQARPVEQGDPPYGEYCERHREEMQDHQCQDGSP